RARARLRARLRKKDLGPDCIPFIFFIQRPQAPADLARALVHVTVRTALPARPEPAAPPHRRGVWLRRTAVALLAAAALTVVGTPGRGGPAAATAPDLPAPAGPTGGVVPPRLFRRMP